MKYALVSTFPSLLQSNNPLIRLFRGLWDTRQEESNVHFDLFRFIPSHNGLMAVKTSWHILFLLFLSSEITKIPNITLIQYQFLESRIDRFAASV